ncbi:7627_t:CDS:2 [Gigaspora rosea]|nr:7627_t:CDS:2 [Gigaspora rosea]
MYMLRISSKEVLCDNRKKLREKENELQEENGSSKSVKWLTKSRILSCLLRPAVKEGKQVCLIPTDILEEIVCPEMPISKEKELQETW